MTSTCGAFTSAPDRAAFRRRPSRALLLGVLLPALAAARAHAAAPAPVAAKAPGDSAKAPASGATAVAKPAARSAEAILRDFVTATGGEKAIRRHKALHARRTITVPGMGLTGTEERWATADGRLIAITTLPGVGQTRAGSTGKVLWSEDPINGLRILKGAEAEQAHVECAWSPELELKRYFKKVQVVPAPDGAGEALECVELVPRVAPALVVCFDASTHLRVLLKGTHAGPQGDIPFTARQSDWREVDGVRLPFLEEMTAGPMTLATRLEELRFDEPIAPDRFRMPKPGAPPLADEPPAPTPAPAPAK